MLLKVNYDLLKKPRSILVTNALVVIAYNTLFYFHPSNQGWLTDEGFSWTNLFRFILIEQFAIELITTTLLFVLIWQYARLLKLRNLSLKPSAVIQYLGKFLPLFLLAFFIFNPFTQSARYLLNEFSALSREVYFEEYLFNWSLYPVYLIPVFLTGYGVLIYNLVLLHNKQLALATEDIEKLKSKPKYISKLITSDDWGEVPIETHQVIWFEKDGRKYFAQTRKNRLRTRETLSELENRLNPDKFVRINRSVIVNVRHILNYSYWENEKYILRLNDEKQTEFVMSRDRLKKIKTQLQLTA